MRDESPNVLDALRLVMAICVIFGHAYWLSAPTLRDPLNRWSHGQTDFGGLAVCVFFAVSGYLIAMSGARASTTRSFLSRRIRRIYPAFLAALTLTAFVATPLGIREKQPYFSGHLLREWIGSCLFLNEWKFEGAFDRNVYKGLVNGSLWTIKYEFACYLVVAGLVACGGLRRPRLILGIAAASYGVHLCITLNLLRIPTFQLSTYCVLPEPGAFWLCHFFIGAAIWAYRDRVRYQPIWVISAAALVITACSLAMRRPFQVVSPLTVPYLTLALSTVPIRFLQDFATRVGGDYSYGVYLYAFPIQQLVTQTFGGEMSPLLNFAISTPIALAAGVASWHGIEKRWVHRNRSEHGTTVVPS